MSVARLHCSTYSGGISPARAWASSRRRGQKSPVAGGRPPMMAAASLVTCSGDGSVPLRPAWTRRRLRAFYVTWIRHPRAVVALPTAPEVDFSSDCMRVLLLRRPRAPLPHAPRRCRCGGKLDVLGDHRSACPTAAGVLGLRGAPLERAAARVCRETGSSR